MKYLKVFITSTSLIILTLVSMSAYGAENVKNNKDSIVCEKCGIFPGIENLKSFASDINLTIVSKLDALKKHLNRPSLISKDISYLPYLKESKKGEVVLWYTIIKF